MADLSHIEWTDATWNPVTGCSVVSPGCTNCYAMRLAGMRLKHHPSRAGLTQDTKAGPVWTGEVRLNEAWLDQPLRWKRPRMIFVCAHGDLFHEAVPDEWIDRVFAIMALCPQHTFQVLTKRAKRMREYLSFAGSSQLDRGGGEDRFSTRSRIVVQAVIEAQRAQLPISPLVGEMASRPEGGAVPRTLTQWPLPNVWLGVSAERQQEANERVPELLATPAAIRFVSAEPLLGPIDFWKYLHPLCDRCPPWETPCRIGCEHCTKLDWIIVGGESGDGARPMHPDWPRSIRDQCASAQVPFFFKQWGEHLGGVGEDMGDGVMFHAASSEAVGRYLSDTDTFGWFDPDEAPDGPMWLRLGKKRAGRLLDGRTHDAFPKVPS